MKFWAKFGFLRSKTLLCDKQNPTYNLLGLKQRVSFIATSEIFMSEFDKNLKAKSMLNFKIHKDKQGAIKDFACPAITRPKA